MINVVAQEISKVFLTSAAEERFNQNSLAVVAVDLSHITVTLMCVVMAKFIARKSDLTVVVTEFTTLLCLCVALAEYCISGVDHPVVDHSTTTVGATYAATVELFRKSMVLHAVLQEHIVQMCMFAVTARSILVGKVFRVAEVTAIRQANKYVVLAEFCQRAAVLHVVAQ